MTEQTAGKFNARSYTRFTTIAIVLLLAVAGVILFIDRKQLAALSQTSDWRYMAGAIAFTAVSYLAGATSFVLLMPVFGIKVKASYLHKTGLVSLCMCNVVGTPTDTSLRLLVLGRRGIPNSEVISASFLMQYFKNLCYYSLVPASLLWVAFVHPLPRFGASTIILIACLLILVLAVATAIVFLAGVRGKVLRLIGRVWKAVTRRDIHAHLDRFNATLAEGTTSLLKRKRQLLPLALTTGLEVSGIIAALWFCYAAFGMRLEAGVLLTGFNFGVTLGLFGFIPGRIGVQEASVAGILVLFGLPFSQGVIAAVLFRGVYYLLPFILTLPLYWSLLREKPAASH
jgi:uncharacterized protein (TIRG00374 family)